MGRACCTCSEENKCIQDSGREICEKETIRKPRRRWEDYIKVDLIEIVGFELEFFFVKKETSIGLL